MKRVVSLSLDLDNKWSYLKTYGSEAWRDLPSYLDVVVPRVLEFLRRHDVRITFFIVGQDAALEKNRAALRMIAEAGHEIGNHSFNHEPWLHLYEDEEIVADLTRAEEAIHDATGVRVDGFRGPGYSLSESVLRILEERGYRYDASAFPNILNPLARAYFFAKSNLSAEEREQRKALFGSLSDALRPVKPYRWDLSGKSMTELPVTTMPVFKTPAHFSYLLYLWQFSPLAARCYLRFFLLMCAMTRTEPSMLLHPLDFLGADDDADLEFFPGMRMPSSTKLEAMDQIFSMLLDKLRPVTMGEHIELIGSRGNLKVYQPTFTVQQAKAARA